MIFWNCDESLGACSLEHFLLAKMTPKLPFERARDFDTSHCEVTTALASLHI